MTAPHIPTHLRHRRPRRCRSSCCAPSIATTAPPCAVRRDGALLDTTFAELGTRRPRDRRRPDRARRAARRPRRDPRQHASRMDGRRLRRAVRRRDRRARLPHQLARGVRATCSPTRARACSSARTPRQLEKIERVRDQLPALEHVFTMLAGRRGALGRGPARRAADAPDGAVDARPRRWRRHDAATIVYTSGTTGPPKGCVLTHDNLVATIRMYEEQLRDELKPGVVIFMFLPLAHSLARVVQMVALDVGATLSFWQGDPKRLLDDIAEARPMYLPSVPRVFEKIHARASGSVEDASRVRRLLFDWAIATGGRARAIERRGELARAAAAGRRERRRPAGALTRARPVRRGPAARAHRRRADRPRRARVLRRLRRRDPRGLRHDGDVRRGDAQHPGRLSLRHGRQAAARQRGCDRRGRRGADARTARVRRLLPRRGRDARHLRRRLAAVGRPGRDRRGRLRAPSPAARRT